MLINADEVSTNYMQMEFLRAWILTPELKPLCNIIPLIGTCEGQTEVLVNKSIAGVNS